MGAQNFEQKNSIWHSYILAVCDYDSVIDRLLCILLWLCFIFRLKTLIFCLLWFTTILVINLKKID